MINDSINEILSIYNYVDCIVITDEKGIVKFFRNLRPDLNILQEKDTIGKSILQIYRNRKLTKEKSSIYRVLKTGKPILNELQSFTNYKGDVIDSITTTLPVIRNEKLIGVVDISFYDSREIRINNSICAKDMYSVDDIISVSKEMEVLKENIKKVSNTSSSVLIFGETGTGKELVAQSIHTNSNRKSKKFVSQNCAAIPSTLLESILFGTVKGSYTGSENKKGLFEIANGGTVFLDEINSMDLSLQAKLLKIIEEKKVTRIGSFSPINIDVKIISATNEEPVKCVLERKLREDLFYRLSVVQLHIEPLRNRKDDIECLIEHFIGVYNVLMGKKIIGIEEDVRTIFNSYSWPGNVRELKNIIEGAFNICDAEKIRVSDISKYIVSDYHNKLLYDINEKLSLSEMTERFEKNIIKETINSSNSLIQAAEKLRISKQLLNYKLKKYQLK